MAALDFIFYTGTAFPKKYRDGCFVARAWGRPVGLLQLPDGSMLVSDDGGGRIWRVSYASP